MPGEREARGKGIYSMKKGTRSSRRAKEQKKPKRGALRVSKATGGLMPGIDISDSAALQEMEDLEYVERMKRGFK